VINIIISGSKGFLGCNWISFTKNISTYNNISFERNTKIKDLELTKSTKSVFLHLAGKAHDTIKSIDSKVYYEVNTDLTKKIFDEFLESDINIFIMISSVKAVADHTIIELTEDSNPDPITDYGKSKLYAEQYILSKNISDNKKVFILRPCMIHGPSNKGNLNLLFNLVSKNIPWPLGLYNNTRSFCSIENICFVIRELIDNENIPSGVYNIADDEPLSTNELIRLIAYSQGKKPYIWNLPMYIINIIAKLGDIVNLPFNTERLNKLTESYIVSNSKIKKAINKTLPVSSKEGLIKTFKSFMTYTR